MHYLIDYCKFIKHHSYVCPRNLKHNLLTIRALLWLQHHSCALLVDLRGMTGRCSQMNLPVNIHDTLSLRCCWAPNGGQNVGLFLFPPHRYRFASFFLGLDLRGHEVVQLFLVHILGDYSINQPHTVFNEFIELVWGDILWAKQIFVQEANINVWLSLNFFGFTLHFLGLSTLENVSVLDRSQSFEKSKRKFTL